MQAGLYRSHDFEETHHTGQGSASFKKKKKYTFLVLKPDVLENRGEGLLLRSQASQVVKYDSQ